MHNRIARCTLLACACGLLAGCGWTARDQFYHNRALVLKPQQGDGSQVTFSTEPQGVLSYDPPQYAQYREDGAEANQ